MVVEPPIPSQLLRVCTGACDVWPACRRYADLLVHRLLSCVVEWEGLKQPGRPGPRRKEGRGPVASAAAAAEGGREGKAQAGEKEGGTEEEEEKRERKRADPWLSSAERDTREEEEKRVGEEEDKKEREGQGDDEGEEGTSDEIKAFREHVIQTCGTAVSLQGSSALLSLWL